MTPVDDRLYYIGTHKNAFDIDNLYPLELFEQFVTTTGNCLIECSGKMKQDQLYPARFDLQFSDHKPIENLNAALNFFKTVEARVNVNLNYELLHQFLGNDFDVSKVQTILAGVDLRHELPESRLKVFIRIGDYPEKNSLAQQLCGESPELQKLLRSDTLHIGFDFNVDGRSAIELYPEVTKEEFNQPKTRQTLEEILYPTALKPLAIPNLMGIGFSRANEANVLYYHIEDIRDFLSYFPVNDTAHRVHDFCLQQEGSKKCGSHYPNLN
ncbi:LynF/TruF/PatF family peptide O-prenyltransferase [Roseofilum reptotaenium CS-1145]|uniref:LynF/TruF/PatF family peptide O-prenyltransferase n=1 Tax=Roseofilum reptotaenium TaxID=1233427 RepID=UPI000AC1525A|nr:LynF/TruF/PatF family peptide O-prenyltransferase [Roseofilum reptotaenium]MDB9517518.1 LynF/TruF/PatF family peptide O-prenyltransferase [Roseofilum reptotaenium CS-1145]